MAERDIFRVAVRILGVLLLVFAIADAFLSFSIFLHWHSDKYYSALDRASAGLAYLLAGFIVIAGSSALTRLLYGAGAL